MNENKMVQCVLEASNGAKLVTWLDKRDDLEVGKWVTLSDHEEPLRRWEVLTIGPAMNRGSFVSGHNSGVIHDKDFIRDGKGSFKNNKG